MSNDRVKGTGVPLRVALTVVFILAIHAAILADRPVLAVLALFAICLVNLALSRLAGGGGFMVWLILAGVTGAAGLGAYNGAKGLEQVILLPPVIVHGGLLYLFGRTVLPGREPLISAFRRLTGAEMTPRALTYTRRLTICWVGYFAVSLGASIGLALYGSSTAWSWVVNLGLPATGIGFFLCEHLYRARFLHHFGSVSLARTLAAVLQPEAWSAGTGGRLWDK